MKTQQVGYSGKSVIQKLGFKENMILLFLHLPKDQNLKEWGEMPGNIRIVKSLQKELDCIHFFTKQISEYKTILPTLIPYLKGNGMIWVSWPKKSSKVPTGLNENLIREFALELGLVDIKVCAIDEIWSGLKLVIRKSNR
ncbi:Conserved hypothetical protein [Leptospira biflexa serovar Patoc strain 'Patoc 1 (Ames)']|uniref:DUF3052 domain-containing protein n=1 Tax=Leptospira biflexa serovar Patoc (strain Patoc 1 / ATCC 23582 / Paris) TaxID=456481 RepID=B0SJU5_LEPBP|nr:DUF3052 family protein [Leptospira biflexa]ABZ92662.1 Conserved hypothetical protein [Leptospira biflexa serovar Patoc strain 'Patoc 1 (Ames)']ABZ96262.1 Conserved hypothetical protein [Leptospira biflexa serovar Patoc strain 'Patoc 1 (Paris)']